MPEERVKISPRFRTGIPKISAPQKFSIFHNQSSLHPIASIFFLIFFGKHWGRKIKSQNPRKLTNSWTWKFIPSMTVTLPRALEVCGVTRSIRCPFKCVPYKRKLHCTMKSHITTFLYPTIPQLCPTVILKGKECKASSERAQGQRAAHKGRGSHLSTVVPLHICCRLPQGSPLSTEPILKNIDSSDPIWSNFY